MTDAGFDAADCYIGREHRRASHVWRKKRAQRTLRLMVLCLDKKRVDTTAQRPEVGVVFDKEGLVTALEVPCLPVAFGIPVGVRLSR